MHILATALTDRRPDAAPNHGLTLGSTVPNICLTDLKGRVLSLATQWQHGPVLLFFMRHAGCALCRAHLWQLRAAHAEIGAHGGRVTVIALTDAATTASFMTRHPLPFTVLPDPARTCYRAFGLTEGSTSEIGGATVLVKQLKQALRGNLPYVLPRAPIYQLGGSFIVDTSGVVRLAHVARPIYNYPSLATYLSVFDTLARAG